MNHKLLTKLALTGIKNNKRAVISYVSVSAITVMIFYIMVSIAWSKYLVVDGKPLFYGAEHLSLILRLGSFVVAIIAVLFLFYGNRFVMRNRKKEIGLYGVLGLSKKNVSWIMMIDSLVQAGSVLGIGLIAGTFLNKLMLLFLYKAVRQEPVNGLLFSWNAFKFTLILFGAAFFICFIRNLLSVRLGSPIALLHSENMGEKEPKVQVLTLISGIVCLVAGYYIALSSKGSFTAIQMIFVSILLVIAATYNLFVAGSIFILKVLKKDPKFYYKRKNFFSVSNLIFRMKHNASGLASICILSTGVILLMVCSLSLMMLGEQNINMMFPTDLMLHTRTHFETDASEISGMFSEAVKNSGVDAGDVVVREYTSTTAVLTEGRLETLDLSEYDFTKMENIYFVTVDDYNKYTGSAASLADDEVLCFSSECPRKAGETMSVFNGEYRIKETIKSDGLHYIFDSTMSLFPKEIIVVSDKEKLLEMSRLGRPEDEDNGLMMVFAGVDFNRQPSAEQFGVLESGLNEAFGGSTDISYKQQSREYFYSLYGGVFFVGIFLAVLFLVVTVVIIYYKQISEGYEDRKRFKILANAGMTDGEAKQTISTQIMILFFMPVCTAIIHMIVASRIVRQFLQALVYINMPTFILAFVIVCLVFFAVYTLVYRLTSKQYYEIVYVNED